MLLAFWPNLFFLGGGGRSSGANVFFGMNVLIFFSPRFTWIIQHRQKVGFRRKHWHRCSSMYANKLFAFPFRERNKKIKRNRNLERMTWQGTQTHLSCSAFLLQLCWKFWLGWQKQLHKTASKFTFLLQAPVKQKQETGRVVRKVCPHRRRESCCNDVKIELTTLGDSFVYGHQLNSRVMTMVQNLHLLS